MWKLSLANLRQSTEINRGGVEERDEIPRPGWLASVPAFESRISWKRSENANHSTATFHTNNIIEVGVIIIVDMIIATVTSSSQFSC
jgi:hypothetical protein